MSVNYYYYYYYYYYRIVFSFRLSIRTVLARKSRTEAQMNFSLLVNTPTRV